jgi:putative nucleotidyltransferase with HDIG domain
MDDKVPVKRVLLVEDDDAFRGLLGQIFESQGYEVRLAENGLVAKTIFDLNYGAFDLVLTDVKMPELDGVSLLKHIRSKAPQVNVIVATGFSEILEAQEAFSLGAKAFLAKPFRIAELEKAIELAFAAEPEVNKVDDVSSDEFSYCKIHVDDFNTSTKLISDIYIRLGESKYIKVAHEGSEIPIDRVKTYKEKNVVYFYVRVEDFGKYIGLHIKIANHLKTTPKISREKKLKLFKHTSEIMVHQAFVEGLEKTDIDAAQDLIANAINIIGDEPDLFELLTVLESHADQLYIHSVSVSIYASMIARKLGWTSQATLFKVSLAGLFHDIGKKEIPRAILDKPRSSMTVEEIKMMESHCTRGREILADFPMVPADVVQMVYQHHERNTGGGYPNRLDKRKIHPMTQPLMVADEFSSLMLKTSRPTDPALARKSIVEIYEYKRFDLDMQCLKVLMEIFKVPIPEEMTKLKAGFAL